MKTLLKKCFFLPELKFFFEKNFELHCIFAYFTGIFFVRISKLQVCNILSLNWKG